MTSSRNYFTNAYGIIKKKIELQDYQNNPIQIKTGIYQSVSPIVSYLQCRIKSLTLIGPVIKIQYQLSKLETALQRASFQFQSVHFK